VPTSGKELGLETDGGQGTGLVEYRINPKDTLEVKVYPDEELSREVTVSKVGTINFPLMGEIQVAGLTITDLEKKMSALLERDYLVYHQVHVRVQRFHSLRVSILGEVRSPGTYELDLDEGETTLLEGIAKAGGFSDIANIKNIKIVRIHEGQKRTFQVNAEDIIKGRKKDVLLKPNDIIIVGQSLF
jgi:polysaccharide export outer membrane protein